jgi:hypothetical protein
MSEILDLARATSAPESQRDSGLQPRVAPGRYPGAPGQIDPTARPSTLHFLSVTFLRGQSRCVSPKPEGPPLNSPGQSPWELGRRHDNLP